MFFSAAEQIDREAKQYDYGENVLKVKNFIYDY